MNRRSNGNKRFPKNGKSSKVREDKSEPRNTKMCANDPSWYIREGQLAKDVASLSFNNAIGINTSVDPDFGSAAAGLQPMKFSAPGIMAIHTIAAPGFSNSATSAVNIASKNLYSFVRHQNSGHSNYDSPDLMLYFLAMDSAFNLIYHLQRVIGVATLFSQKNRYIGDSLINSMGILPQNLRENLAQYRARLNMSIVKASVFAVPAVFSLFKRHSWMYSNLFADNPVDKSQIYLYLPSILHKYVETEGAGSLQPEMLFSRRDGEGQNLTTNPTSFGIAINKLDELLGALQASEDINIMSGDILKAYGKENCYSLALVPENYTVAPIYSDEILDQIHNTRFAGMNPRKANATTTDAAAFSLESLAITQDTSIGAGNIMFTPAFSGVPNLSYEAILDMADNEPTPERILVGTRNTIGGMTMKVGTGTSTNWLTFLTSFASDIPLFANMSYVNSNGAITSVNVYGNGIVGPTAPVLSYIRMFRKAPIVYIGNANTTDGTYTLTTPSGDIENYVTVGESALTRMHESAILSMLGVPV